jgi:hypothetical protein
VDLINGWKTRRSRKAGESFRDIVADADAPLHRVKRQFADAPDGRRRREMRREIRDAGGWRAWWEGR